MPKDENKDKEIDNVEEEILTPEEVAIRQLYKKLLAEHPQGLAYLNDDGEYVFIDETGKPKKI